MGQLGLLDLGQGRRGRTCVDVILLVLLLDIGGVGLLLDICGVGGVPLPAGYRMRGRGRGGFYL